MADIHEFPALFTIEGSSRHEIFLVNPGHELADLTKQIEALISSSPNCAEFMSKFKSNKESSEKVKQVKVRWAAEGRDLKLFPRETVLTEDNCEAVLRMMAHGVGKDVIDVTVEQQKGNDGKKEER
ncbi:hypothetical protein MBLNU230_g6953t1 [Neophaeotheca triangularis]